MIVKEILHSASEENLSQLLDKTNPDHPSKYHPSDPSLSSQCTSETFSSSIFQPDELENFKSSYEIDNFEDVLSYI